MCIFPAFSRERKKLQSVREVTEELVTTNFILPNYYFVEAVHRRYLHAMSCHIFFWRTIKLLLCGFPVRGYIIISMEENVGKHANLVYAVNLHASTATTKNNTTNQ